MNPSINKIQSAGIIAAGEGRRFKEAGIMTHKPLIPVLGQPLLWHTLHYFEMLNINRVVIIFNEQEQECVDWVRQHFPKLQVDFIVKSTRSSFESFSLVGERLGSGRHLISTVDSICSPEELKKMIDFQPDYPGSDHSRFKDNVCLGITDFVDDEKPLWVSYDEKSQKIAQVGTDPQRFVTAGFYLLSGDVLVRKPNFELSSLRVYLKWLCDQGVPFYGVPLESVIDIDSPKDIALAEKKIFGF